MSSEPEREDRRVVNDPDRIRELAEIHGAVPVATGRGVDLRTDSESSRGDRITWSEFAERFDDDQVVMYRPGERDVRSAEPFEVVDRSTQVEAPSEVNREAIATSDTGDHEPVTSEVRETDRDDDSAQPSTAPIGDLAHASEPEANLVLDEIHEYESGFAETDDEFLVFLNDGEDPLDVSGWTVENDAGQSYQFPDPTVVEPGGQLTLYSGSGTDDENHRYWGADDPVWGNERNTVTVMTQDGDVVVRQPYEA
jgi:hypothetical protein